ncbi:hypothetical protein [Micromonospora sp. RTP1Z1]|uniref:hypothetical protein n=1 Tax=Micromonospora sp. RTP1Z1 TaxID=2994043 RepID=UPI0029C6198F|nr:hypothetical protein [Micromonospora sp. RTP1Z1]
MADEPDGVVVWGTAPDSGVAARALRRAGYRGPIFLDAGAVAEETSPAATPPPWRGAYAVRPACLGGSTLTNNHRRGARPPAAWTVDGCARNCRPKVTEGIAGGYTFAPIRHIGVERDSQGTWTPYA